jgi:hypothetical protein
LPVVAPGNVIQGTFVVTLQSHGGVTLVIETVLVSPAAIARPGDENAEIHWALNATGKSSMSNDRLKIRRSALNLLPPAGLRAAVVRLFAALSFGSRADAGGRHEYRPHVVALAIRNPAGLPRLR